MAQRLYEAMFLIDAAKAGSEFPAAIRHIAGLLDRHGGQIERIEKWREGKLAYRVGRSERGVYVLVHFQSAPESIAELRRDIQLSEEILRVLIVRAEGMPELGGDLYTGQGEPAPARQELPAEATGPDEAEEESAEPSAEATGPDEAKEESSEPPAEATGPDEAKEESAEPPAKPTGPDEAQEESAEPPAAQEEGAATQD